MIRGVGDAIFPDTPTFVFGVKNDGRNSFTRQKNAGSQKGDFIGKGGFCQALPIADTVNQGRYSRERKLA